MSFKLWIILAHAPRHRLQAHAARQFDQAFPQLREHDLVLARPQVALARLDHLVPPFLCRPRCARDWILDVSPALAADGLAHVRPVDVDGHVLGLGDDERVEAALDVRVRLLEAHVPPVAQRYVGVEFELHPGGPRPELLVSRHRLLGVLDGELHVRQVLLELPGALLSIRRGVLARVRRVRVVSLKLHGAEATVLLVVLVVLLLALAVAVPHAVAVVLAPRALHELRRGLTAVGALRFGCLVRHRARSMRWRDACGERCDSRRGLRVKLVYLEMSPKMTAVFF